MNYQYVYCEGKHDMDQLPRLLSHVARKEFREVKKYFKGISLIYIPMVNLRLISLLNCVAHNCYRMSVFQHNEGRAGKF